MKERQVKAHMRAAQVYADLSYCNRLKVGCVIVRDDRIISIGYNGTPPGADNTCEDADWNTKPEVLHAEENAFRKLEHINDVGGPSHVFTTIAPCFKCSQLILSPEVLSKLNITHVYYRDQYRSDDGIKLLRDAGLAVIQLSQ